MVAGPGGGHPLTDAGTRPCGAGFGRAGQNGARMADEREFEARPDTIGAIRTYVQHHLLRQGLDDDRIDAAVLCTSELATNALLHGEGRIGVALDVHRGRRARVIVRDDNPARPEPRDASPEAEAGRGLMLVGMFADEWGVDTHDDGKAVWFELDLRDQPPPPAATVEADRRRWSRA